MGWRDVAIILGVAAVLSGVHQWGRYEGAQEARKQMRLVVSGYVNGALDEYYKRSDRPPFGAKNNTQGEGTP